MNANVSPLRVMYCAKPLPGKEIWTKGQFALLQRRISYQLIFQERILRHCKLKLFAESNSDFARPGLMPRAPRSPWLDSYVSGTDLTKPPRRGRPTGVEGLNPHYLLGI